METLTHTRKPKCTCIVEAHESTRKRLECTLPRNHEDGQGDGSPRQVLNRRRTRGSRTCVCASTFLLGWHTHEAKGESTSCRGTFWSAWQVPARVSGRHVVRRTTVLTYPGMRPGNRQGQRKRSKFRGRSGTLILEETVGRVWWHIARPTVGPGNLAPWSLSTGSPAGRTLCVGTAQCAVRPT